MAVGRKTGGRQAGTPNKATAEIKEVARQYGTEAVEKLAELMRCDDNPQVQRAAAEALLDRGYGRPSLSVEASTDEADPINIQIVFSDDKPMKPVGGKKAEPTEAKFRHVE
jgi:hypothetical protein